MSTEQKVSNSVDSQTDEDAKLKQINVVFLWFIVVGFLSCTCCAGFNHITILFLWALASLAVGSFVGLLFGIPRIRKKKKSANPTEAAKAKDDGLDYQQESNNNLIEVSDWLTKIIVGLGLVELNSMPETLKRISRPLATCLDSNCGMAIALGLIIFFTAAGFLAGYINSRTLIARVITESDNRVKNKVRELEQRISENTAQQADNTAKIEAIRGRSEGDVVPTESTPLATAEASAQEPDRSLLKMAGDYENINDNSQRIRVAKKEQSAAAMLRYIVKAKISKDSLFSWITANPSDGLIVAFASYILSSPQPDEVAKLVAIGPKADWLHVKYRVALALRALVREGYGTSQDWKEAVKILQQFNVDARNREDAPLMNLSQETIELIRSRF